MKQREGCRYLADKWFAKIANSMGDAKAEENNRDIEAVIRE